jgi:hypothetical protein
MANKLVVFLNHRVVFELLANASNGYSVEPFGPLVFLSCKYKRPSSTKFSIRNKLSYQKIYWWNICSFACARRPK